MTIPISCKQHSTFQSSLYLPSRYHMRGFSSAPAGRSSSFTKRSGAGRVTVLLCRKQNVSTFFLAFFLSCLFLLMKCPHDHQSSVISRFSFMDALEDSLHDLITKNAGDCDYSAGAWVRTRRRPLYTGRDCQRWLSPMWACRRNANRSSFYYENLRWQPHGCSLPPFHPPTFLHRMRNKTIAFIGDSLGRQQFQSLMCLLTRGRDENDNVLDVGADFGFPSYIKSNKSNNSKSLRPSSWAYRFKETNTTILFSWSPTLCHLEPLAKKETSFSNISSPLSNQTDKVNNSTTSQVPEVAFHVDIPPVVLSSNLHKFDVIILNTGPHWNLNKFVKNKWKAHSAGKPLVMDMTIDSVNKLYNYTIYNLFDWLNMQVETGATMANIFYRSLSPHHFFHGEWNSGGRCDNTHFRLLNSLSMKKLSKPFYKDIISDTIGHGTSVNILNVTWLSQLRDDAHISKYTLKPKNGSQDCLHWCLPGVPDTWNEILYAHLVQTKIKCNKTSLR